uniref:Uncharacterized protein n=1 Tax=Bornetia secundiflora TaxID=2575637 RepID=A0A4D6WMR3_9FLOR|nr:hypothetical protein [Bornetia secundiflora]
MFLANNNFFVVRLYTSSIFIFLLMICIVLSLDILKILSYLLLLNSCINDGKLIINTLHVNDIKALLSTYIKQNRWMLSIALLELCCNTQMLDTIDLSMIFGYCYQQIAYFSCAKYYYRQALREQPHNLDVLQHLASIYSVLNENNNLKDICSTIRSIDSSNQWAHRS